ncbi:hypothetical protein F4801DRAFT_553344 [Xylaria longipes]|nr:hypothetical protein F4801DRAFT_553344 [Xylaria longipes]
MQVEFMFHMILVIIILNGDISVMWIPVTSNASVIIQGRFWTHCFWLFIANAWARTFKQHNKITI